MQLGTRDAEKGWRDLMATARNAAVDAWDHLTRSPTDRSPSCHPLLGDLGTIQHAVRAYDRWQLKVTGGGRIWYAVIPAARGEKCAGTVVLEPVSIGHPDEALKTDR